MILKDCKNILDDYILRTYETTWKVGWEHIVSTCGDILRDMVDDGLYIRINDEVECNEEYKKTHNVWKCPSILTENRKIAISGFNHTLKRWMRMELFNQSNVCLFYTVKADEVGYVEKYGADVWTHYLDSVEINAYKELLRHNTLEDYVLVPKDKKS